MAVPAEGNFLPPPLISFFTYSIFLATQYFIGVFGNVICLRPILIFIEVLLIRLGRSRDSKMMNISEDAMKLHSAATAMIALRCESNVYQDSSNYFVVR